MIFTKKMRSMCRKKIRAGTLSGCWYLCLNPLPRQGQPEKIQIHKDEDKYTKTNTREIQHKISGGKDIFLHLFATDAFEERQAWIGGCRWGAR